MKKVHEHIELNLLEGDVGIEIEAEGLNLQFVDSDLWRTEDDGSLRGAYPTERAEFVLRSPIPAGNVEDAITTLSELQHGAKFNFSFRCSVHVHVNIGGLTYQEFLAYLYLCMLLEEPLMNLCGEERKANRFCLRIVDAEGYLQYLMHLFTNGPKSILDIREDNVRYSAINIGSVKKYGSLEFRGMHGTLDVPLITAWTQTLYRLREVARKYGDPIAVHDAFVKTDTLKFATACLGKNAALFNVKDSIRDMDRSYSLLLDLPYAYKAWEEQEKPKKEEQEKLNKEQGVFGKDIKGHYVRYPIPDNLKAMPIDFADGGWIIRPEIIVPDNLEF